MRQTNYVRSGFGFTCLFLLIAVACFSPSAAAQQTAAAAAPQGSGYFLRLDAQLIWKQLVDGVDYSKEKNVFVKFGDVIATKEKQIIYNAGPYTITFMPFSSFRLQSITEDGNTYTAPEILFGEALFKGDAGRVLLPGQSVICHDSAYLIVDDQKYSRVAAVNSDQELSPEGATKTITIKAGTYLDLGPDGETADAAEPMMPEDIQYYAELTAPPETPKVDLEPSQQPVTVPKSAEFWSQERIALLQDGPESAAGLAIASGKSQQVVQAQPQEVVQVFDKKDSSVKTMTFGTSVSVEQKAGEPPKLIQVKIGKQNATIGSTVSLKFSDLDDKSINISGKAYSASPDIWKLYIRVNGEEKQIDIQSFEYSFKIEQDNPALPVIMGVMIAEEAAESYTEESIISRDKLTSGKIKVTGNASAGKNILHYSLDFVAKDLDGNESNIGNFPIELDLSEISSVEVTYDGSSWEKAKGKEEWTYNISPNDGDIYKVKVRAIDVMDNISEEQFEPYQFKYRAKTEPEVLRDTFNTLMQAYYDRDRSGFFRYVSQDFSSNVDSLRDYNELDSSVRDRFECCSVNIQVSIKDVQADRQSTRGNVDFYWTARGVAGSSNYAVFNFIYEEEQWRLQEVIDAYTFLRPSVIPDSIVFTLEKSNLDADGESTCLVSAKVLDNTGSIVADGVAVTFSVNNGSVNPGMSYTTGGIAETTYTSSTTSGTATITAKAGNVTNNVSIILDPVQPPLPPGE